MYLPSEAPRNVKKGRAFPTARYVVSSSKNGSTVSNSLSLTSVNNTNEPTSMLTRSNTTKSHPYLKIQFPQSTFTYIGGGSYGAAYTIPFNTIVLKELVDLKPMLRNVVEGQELKSGRRRNQNLVIKVANPKSTKDWEWFIKESKHEASVQMSLQNAQAYVRCAGGGRVVIKGRHLVPRLFFAGSHRTFGVFVYVMEIASGKSLDEFNAPGASMSPELYVAIEKAVVGLWMLGYAHGDLHFGNLMYDTKRRTITIIDFGMSVKIPLNISKRIRSGIKSMKHSTALWKETGAQDYVHAVMSQRGRRWFNDDGKLLQVAYSLVPEDLRPEIRQARKNLWNKCSWI